MAMPDAELEENRTSSAHAPTAPPVMLHEITFPSPRFVIYAVFSLIAMPDGLFKRLPPPESQLRDKPNAVQEYNLFDEDTIYAFVSSTAIPVGLTSPVKEDWHPVRDVPEMRHPLTASVPPAVVVYTVVPLMAISCGLSKVPPVAAQFCRAFPEMVH